MQPRYVVRQSSGMSRRALVLAVVLVVGAAAFFVARALRPPSDEEQIRAMIHDAARAADEKRIADVVQGLSERFDAAGVDKRGAKQIVALHVLRGTWVSVLVAGEKIAVERERARAVADVVLSRSGKGKSLSEILPEAASIYRFDLRLVKESGEWRVTTAAWRPITLEQAVAGPELQL